MPTETEHSIEPLEDELREQLRRAGLDDRQAEVVAIRLGWDGEGGTTLEAAGGHAGVTRERVRQLVARVADHLADTTPSLPALSRAIDTVRGMAPARRDDVASRLADEGLSRARFDPYGVLEAARMLGLNPGVTVVGTRVLADGHAELGQRILEIARKLVSHNGAGTVAAVVDTLALDGVSEDLVCRLLDADDEVVWLDSQRDWFFLPTARNRAFNYLRKMLSVSASLTLADVREGLRRPARSINLPRAVLRELCGQIGWIAVDGDLVTATTDLDFRDVLENTEETLVDVFTMHGPVLDRQTAIDLAQERGLDRTTAGLYLGWSPVIERLAINRYALRGADVPAGTLEAMRGVDRRRRVQQGHGWTSSGRLWIGYTLSQSVLDTNVVGVPGALRSELRGRFRIQPADERLGEVATDGQNLWGLGRLLRRYGAEPGDALVLEFDLATMECYPHVGGPDLLDPDNRPSADAIALVPDVAVDDGGLDELLPLQGDFLEEQPTLHPGPNSEPASVHQRTTAASRDLQTSGQATAGSPPQHDAAPEAVATPQGEPVERTQVVQVLLDRIEATIDPLAQEASVENAPEETVTEPVDRCVVPGCGRPGKNKLGVRCRVWREPSSVPGKKKTSALWAPDADAFLCDEHALGGAHITLLFEPNTSGETSLRVIAAPQAEARTRPIKRAAEILDTDAEDQDRHARDPESNETA